MVRGLNLHMNNLDVLVNKCNSRSSLQMTLELIKSGSFIYRKKQEINHHVSFEFFSYMSWYSQIGKYVRKTMKANFY